MRKTLKIKFCDLRMKLIILKYMLVQKIRTYNDILIEIRLNINLFT